MVALASTSARPALADIDPLSGVDFVNITHPGNAPWMGDGTPDDRAIGRGSVGYEYRIGRFEVMTAQWVEFFNAAFDRPAADRIPHVSAPTTWGGSEIAPTVPGGRRWRVPAGREMWATGNISWRTAAIYCNWLCNGKTTNREAFLSGAYDVSTFGYNGNTFTDQQVRTPGAPYFIPTWDEWLKAVHFDPDRFGEGQPGWWRGPDSTDTIPVGGPPGTGDANHRNFPGWNSVPLGSYPQTQSPWGLLDASGATAEWTETVLSFPTNSEIYRIVDGSHWGDDSSGVADLIHLRAADFPSIPTFQFGLRLAASVPSPGSCIPVGAAILILARSRTRRRTYEVPSFGSDRYLRGSWGGGVRVGTVDQRHDQGR